MKWVPPHYASEHSPGPWKWVPFKNWDGGLQAADDTWVIRFDEIDATPENHHDAALIASAPELLELLRELAERLARRTRNEEHGPECENCQADMELVTMARTILGRLK